MQEKLSEIIHFHSNSDGVWVYRMDWNCSKFEGFF